MLNITYCTNKCKGTDVKQEGSKYMNWFESLGLSPSICVMLDIEKNSPPPMWKKKFCIKPEMPVKCFCKMVCYWQNELLTSVSFGLKTNGLAACDPNFVSDIVCNKVVLSLLAKASDMCINSNFINLNKEKDVTELLFCFFDLLVISGCCAETPQQGA